MNKHFTFAAAVACLFTGLPLLYAWEEDVHYGLTKCLALKAGFGEAQAENIAWANQSLDDNSDTAAVWQVGIHISLGLFDKDAEVVSKRMRRYHFPSLLEPPADPETRPVLPDNDYALKLLHRSDDLEQFGKSLHSFQDSWSHRGITDIPFRPGPKSRPTLAWGHPEDRGGWCCHEADLTHLHVDDTVTMGCRSYEEIRKYGKRQGFPVKSLGGCAGLEPSLRDFAKAETKEEKKRWFTENCGLANLSFLDGINLPASKSWLYRLLGQVSGREVQSAFVRFTSDENPAGLWQFTRNFLETWLVKRNLDELLRDVDEETFGSWSMLESPGLSKEVVRKQLVMWLIEDHGLVESLGHGLPEHRGFVRLPNRFTDVGSEFSFASYGSLEEALLPSREGVSIEIKKIDLQVQGARSSYAAVFHLRHLNHDGLILLMGRRAQLNLEEPSLGEDKWEVTGLLWTTS